MMCFQWLNESAEIAHNLLEVVADVRVCAQCRSGVASECLLQTFRTRHPAFQPGGLQDQVDLGHPWTR